MSTQTQRFVPSGLIALALFLLSACSSSSGDGRLPVSLDPNLPPGSRVIGSVVVPPGAEVVNVPGKKLPLIIKKYQGLGN